MRRHYRAVRATAREIDKAIKSAVGALREGRVQQEPAMTDRMLGAIEGALDGKSIQGIRWRAKTLTDRGRNSEEKRFGADFMGVLTLDLPGYHVSKGFLAQAKMVRGTVGPDRKKLVAQCESMLDLSPESFVFLYGRRGVRVVSANAVLAADGDVSDLYTQSALGFFERHLMCQVGDRSIHEPSTRVLETMVDEYRTRSAISVHGEEDSEEQKLFQD